MPQPNFVFFMPDQLRSDALDCFGSPVAETPNIDALAERGVRPERTVTPTATSTAG